MIRAKGGPIRMRPRARLPEPVEDAELETIGAHLTARAIAADGAESRIRRRRVLEFLMRVGRVPTTGQVTRVVERGLTVELPDYGTYGFLSRERLSGKKHRLGDTLTVVLERVDPASGQLDLALAPAGG